MVLGWDGASWDIILPLIEASRMPNLATLMQRGAYGELLTLKPTTSPAIWTSIATGVKPQRHGIRSFVKPSTRFESLTKTLLGRKPELVLCSNADRRVRALWNIASEQGKRVLVVGYHNTFPAEQVAGMMVSNYLVRDYVRRLVQLTDDVGRAPFVYPSQAETAVTRLARRLEDVPWTEMHPLINVERDKYARVISRLRRGTLRYPIWRMLLKAYEYDDFHGRIALEYYDEIDPDFLLVHFQSLDIVGHSLYDCYDTGLLDAEAYEEADNVQSRERRMAFFGHTLEAFYERQDAILGRFLAKITPDTGVMVLSDHGMEGNAYVYEPGTHNEAPPGILIFSAPGVRSNMRIKGATIYDILPTLAASSGLPVARDLDGRILKEAWSSDSLRLDRLTWVETYEKDERFVPHVEVDTGLSREIESELRALGYID
jgi:hypothetical protein